MRPRSLRGAIGLSPQRAGPLRLALASAALAAVAAVPRAAEATAKPPDGHGPALVKRGHHGDVPKADVPRAVSRSAVEAAWVELGPSGAVLARAITKADACPQLTVDKVATRMDERAAPSPPDYPVRSCETALPRDAKRVALGGQRLPLPARRPRRIVVVGDTGCRLKALDGFQACNDPRAWPFASVAKSIARWRPDVVIQVGDYLYREEPCPEGDHGCRGSPFGQNWPTWDADFFSPAAPALRAAPWLFVRGDHELCSRAGPGWFRFLDPRPMPASCQDVTEPYAVDLGRVRMLVLDTALASDRPPLNPNPYVSQFAALRAMAGSNAWLLAHKPMWGLLPDSSGANVTVLNPTLQAASGNSLPPGVRLVLTGHIHLAEVLGFAGHRPPQIVAGISGTLLLPQITAPLLGMDVAGERLTTATTLARHGFFTFTPRPWGWAATIRGVDGRATVRCRLRGGSAACGKLRR
jgi:Calcineurin-like phosphoesterase